MDKHTNLQTVDLWGLEQGQFMTVAITGATGGGNCVLEFKNGSDPAWSIDPTFVGTVTNGILVQRVKCLSAHSRIRFLSNPVATPYYISLVWDAVPNF
jgi:hypothetical protein